MLLIAISEGLYFDPNSGTKYRRKENEWLITPAVYIQKGIPAERIIDLELIEDMDDFVNAHSSLNRLPEPLDL